MHLVKYYTHIWLLLDGMLLGERRFPKQFDFMSTYDGHKRTDMATPKCRNVNIHHRGAPDAMNSRI